MDYICLQDLGYFRSAIGMEHLVQGIADRVIEALKDH